VPLSSLRVPLYLTLTPLRSAGRGGPPALTSSSTPCVVLLLRRLLDKYGLNLLLAQDRQVVLHMDLHFNQCAAATALLLSLIVWIPLDLQLLAFLTFLALSSSLTTARPCKGQTRRLACVCCYSEPPLRHKTSRHNDTRRCDSIIVQSVLS
jgi:hypothetical protein